MDINIVSTDKRYFFLNELLVSNKFISKIITPEEYDGSDVLILSVRDELKPQALEALLKKAKKETLVLTGNENKIKEYLNGKAIDYSRGEDFLMKNAYLTAEATISVIHSLTNESIFGKKIFVSGYGRIGKYLCRIFSSLGAKMYAYARRSEGQAKIIADGFISSSIEGAECCDIIINTAPNVVFKNDILSRLKHACKIELASSNGFENMEDVFVARGLPGKILPKSSAQIIYDTIVPLFPIERDI